MASEKPETHSRPHPGGGRAVYRTRRLWALSAGLPVRRVPIEAIPEFDMDCWFRGRGPTVRQVAEHARRIMAADLAYPIILAADGSLMDGGHRLCRAWIEGRTEIDAVRFEANPEPDEILPG